MPLTRLHEQLDALVSEMHRAASAEAQAAQRVPPGDGHGAQVERHRLRQRVLQDYTRKLHETIVQAEPRCRGGDGYSESWEVTCPNGCGNVLDWQRFLFAGGESGRWCDDDTVMHACPRCGHDLEDVVPELPITDPVLAALRDARPYVFNVACEHRENWRGETAQPILDRIDAILGI